jgi:hypothetical protein
LSPPHPGLRHGFRVYDFFFPQKTWEEDYAAPLPIQAFAMSFFILVGVAVDRFIVVGAGDVSGYLALLFVYPNLVSKET